MSKVKNGRGSQERVRGWRQWKESDGREALAKWRRSGLSAAAFCAREGYSQTRLRYWSERLGEPREVGGTSVSFVPVAWENGADARQIEIERRGVVVRVREDLDIERVARLVAALASGERPC